MNARLLPETEFQFPRDRRTDEQRSDDFDSLCIDKLSNPEWLRDALYDIDLDKTVFALLAAGDDLAFCAKLRDAMNRRATNEARSEAA